MNNATMIKRQLDKIGRQAYLCDGEWISSPFNVCVTHLWRKKSAGFEPEYTCLGESYSKYYLYIGPFNHDITVLSDEAALLIGTEKYEFKCRDAVRFGEDVIYFTGILRLINEVDGYEA